MLTSPALLALALLTAAQDYLLPSAPSAGTQLACKSSLRLELGPGAEEFRARGAAREIDGQGRRHLLERRVSWTDRFGPVQNGRVLEIGRTFDSIGGGMSLAEPGQLLSAPEWKSPLEGTAVKLESQADEARYGVSWLPKRRVAVGARWEIDPSRLRDVLLPLGELAIGVEECETFALASLSGLTMPLPPANLALWFDAANGTSSGSLAACLSEVDCEQGRELARVALDVDVVLDLDHADWLTARIPTGFRARVDRQRMRVALVGKGELLWDIAAGHATSFELKGQVRIELDMAWTVGSPGGPVDLTAAASRSGPVEITYEAKQAR